MSIAITSRDILDRIKAIPELENRVGFTVGGQDMDPMNDKLKTPFVWIVFVTDDVTLQNPVRPSCGDTLKLNYMVKVALDYGRDENKLIDTDLPILHLITSAIHGETPPGLPVSFWQYHNQTLESLDSDRMVWVQNYSIKLGL